jgi:ferritin-like metal-binding protein YciE
MKLDSLKALYIEELRDLYSAENMLVKALPKMAKASSTSNLQKAFESHLEETKGHVNRLDQIFEQLGESPKGKTCKAMQGLIAEGEEMIHEEAEPEIRDAGLISAAQRVEHYEMAGYGTVRTYAHLLGEKDAEKLLQDTLEEEGRADKKLTKIAETVVNKEAAARSSE